MDNSKISVIMQSYLQDYPGARSNPKDKFIRAVNSFKAQLYKNSELIIVADGCETTVDLYNSHFKNDENIQLIYVDKKNNSMNMYEMIDDKMCYRGYPRRIGVSAAIGGFITYMDSDDYILPEHLLAIHTLRLKYPDSMWFINKTWYDNIAGEPEQFKSIFVDENPNKPIKIENLESEWLAVKMKTELITLAPSVFSHTADCKTKCEDTVGVSEDVVFNKKIRQEFEKGYTYEYPTYVRCHMRNAWDF